VRSIALVITLRTGGKQRNLRELTEAFVSKYLHSDNIPLEIADESRAWQTHVFPLLIAFARGMKILLALRGGILEANRRGLIDGTTFSDVTGQWVRDPVFDEIMASQRRIDPAKWK
jgi:hypothetical protein